MPAARMHGAAKPGRPGEELVLGYGVNSLIDNDTDPQSAAADPEDPSQLHREIEDFVKRVSCTDKEKRELARVFSLIQAATAAALGSKVQVHPYGSHASGTATHASDLDCVVVGIVEPDGNGGGYSEQQRRRVKGVLARLASKLQATHEVASMMVLRRPKVPIIKCVTRSGVHVDISIGGLQGPGTADFLTRQLSRWPCARPLAVTVKALLQQKGLLGVHRGGLSSYALVLMVIAHMQQVQLDDRAQLRDLGQLLVSFLERYGLELHPGKTAVSVYQGLDGQLSPFVPRDRFAAQQRRQAQQREQQRQQRRQASRGGAAPTREEEDDGKETGGSCDDEGEVAMRTAEEDEDEQEEEAGAASSGDDDGEGLGDETAVRVTVEDPLTLLLLGGESFRTPEVLAAFRTAAQALRAAQRQSERRGGSNGTRNGGGTGGEGRNHKAYRPMLDRVIDVRSALQREEAPVSSSGGGPSSGGRSGGRSSAGNGGGGGGGGRWTSPGEVGGGSNGRVKKGRAVVQKGSGRRRGQRLDDVMQAPATAGEGWGQVFAAAGAATAVAAPAPSRAGGARSGNRNGTRTSSSGSSGKVVRTTTSSSNNSSSSGGSKGGSGGKAAVAKEGTGVKGPSATAVPPGQEDASAKPAASAKPPAASLKAPFDFLSEAGPASEGDGSGRRRRHRHIRRKKPVAAAPAAAAVVGGLGASVRKTALARCKVPVRTLLLRVPLGVGL